MLDSVEMLIYERLQFIGIMLFVTIIRAQLDQQIYSRLNGQL